MVSCMVSYMVFVHGFVRWLMCIKNQAREGQGVEYNQVAVAPWLYTGLYTGPYTDP